MNLPVPTLPHILLTEGTAPDFAHASEMWEICFRD